ncbi:hypothetical protein QBC46DRAFT_451693 [Diplogelasinospora grovesii]|uniref:Uncharacterized protein n=1 Tax=Diplogelasinospora grovesii TaxID=303347 RepID=A0AAN6N260_9PEZI|nr:hypothetical protein QBC46DRAFT_451693 [Diplogelasinospora grovesii]
MLGRGPHVVRLRLAGNIAVTFQICYVLTPGTCGKATLRPYVMGFYAAAVGQSGYADPSARTCQRLGSGQLWDFQGPAVQEVFAELGSCGNESKPFAHYKTGYLSSVHTQRVLETSHSSAAANSPRPASAKFCRKEWWWLRSVKVSIMFGTVGGENPVVQTLVPSRHARNLKPQITRTDEWIAQSTPHARAILPKRAELQRQEAGIGDAQPAGQTPPPTTGRMGALNSLEASKRMDEVSPPRSAP